MTPDTVRQLEANIRSAKEIVEIEAAMIRLKENRDFQKVILKGYFEQEAVRLVHLMADPSMQTKERQDSIHFQQRAIAGLADYFRTVSFNAGVARKAISSDEATIEEILAEEAGQ